MRSIWNGAISFGLVSIPIKLVNATESHSISFRQIHVSDGGRVRYRKVCELDGEEVPSAEIGKGYEEADGSIVPITEEDLAQLPLATAKTIEIMSFVPAEEIDPLQMDAAYYLAANGATAAKPYTLLREALKRSQKVAIAKYALRGRERLGMLRVVDDVIAMHGLLWPDEIRAPEGVAPEAEVSVREAELDLADALMATLGDVEMTSLHDDYREAVEAMIVAKSGGAFEPTEAVVEPAGGQVIDLMAALEKSVRAAKASRGEADTSGEAEAEVTPIRRKAGAGARAGAGAGAGAAAPKAVGGKKSTAASAKKTAASAGTKKKTTSTAGKSAAGKSSSKSTAKSTAKTAAAKKTGAAAAKKAATPRKRTSA
ncbi:MULTISPECIES: non-homologous end joining protein Ku [Streptomyces]|uniref:Non-homologous end joining protein Ku n=1 Tax=Streptomyces spororaveus TaxID=284039 RepID=A0ABQ3TBH5_9ACTN|nr:MULTISPECIES: Ku protein [Streptomyces]MCM9081836.1 Ku protein [Streptomyces spororaveus]MCX5303734.1 Ku protein [Streptomyces sp. NBC_00160]GHI77746.1 non-homologous end joining protein Ku [Streptomyces spororaveus]